ncbi:MAG TPA: DUF6049 family protein [Marmoricola sp.]|nr:DUF6049 family protein [Marmoricola sp.]
MTRARPATPVRWLLLAVLLLVPLVPAYAAPQPRGHKPTAETITPLAVNLTSIEPAVVPRRGPITITGTVTNRSDEDWRDVSVYPFASSRPITTQSSLAEALETSEGTVVGSRFFDTKRAVAQIGSLEVGKTAGFQLVLPRRILPIPANGPGVYWIGAHALGANSSGSDSLSDGRARTFITQVGARPRQTRVALVIPVRANAARTPDGSVAAAKRWSSLLAPGGRLDRIEGLVASAPAQSVNLLIDPNVLDVVTNLAAGNPPAQLGLDESATKDADPTARDWLNHLQSDTTRQFTRHLPYADPDIAATLRHRPDVLRSALHLSRLSLKEHNIASELLLAPEDGQFDPDQLTDVGAANVLLDAAAAAEDLTAADYATSSRAHLIFADPMVTRGPEGGTSPGNPNNALALRQLVLARAYLDQANRDPDAKPAARPIVVNLPRLWDPGTFWKSANFFSGLQQPWLRLGGLPTANAEEFSGELEYDDAGELPAANIEQARKGLLRARTLGELLTATNNAQLTFSGAALAATSYDARVHPRLARRSADGADEWVSDQLGRVRITGSDFVTLSGGSGPVSVSIVNGLDHPIEVGIKAITPSRLIQVETPEPVRLEPNQRASVKVQIHANTVGAQEIGLAPVTTGDLVLSEPFTFNLRTSPVGKLIWGILIAGGALLLVMIIRRIIRRVRTRSWALPEDEPGEFSDGQQR